MWTRLRERFTVIPGAHRPRHQRNGAIGLVIVAVLAGCGAYYSFVGYWPLLPRGGSVVRAAFSTAFDVNTATPVRINGLDVGRVDEVSPGDGGRTAIVTLRINDAARGMLRSDASAAIKERLILGGTMYVALTPGRSAAPLAGDTIPLGRTSVQVNLDQVLGALTPAARQGLRGTLKGLRSSFASAAPVQSTVDALGSSLGEVTPAVDAVRGRMPGDLPRLITGFDRIVSALSSAEGSLGGLIDSAATTFGVTAARSADLGNLLDGAPPALTVTRAQLAGLDHTIDLVGPLATALTPGARQLQGTLLRLEPALAQTRPLLEQAQPLVRALDPAVLDLKAAASQGVPLISSITPAVNRVNDVLLPFLYKTDPQAQLRMYELPGPTVAAVDSLSGLFDSAGHVAAFDGGIGPQALHDYAPCSLYLSDPSYKLVTCENLVKYVATLFGGPAQPPSLLKGVLRP